MVYESKTEVKVWEAATANRFSSTVTYTELVSITPILCMGFLARLDFHINQPLVDFGGAYIRTYEEFYV